MAGPLSGILVFDWTRLAECPFAGGLLGPLGAEGIKGEGPEGDWQITVPPTMNGVALLYIGFNMNKRCVTLDVKKPQEYQAALRLLATCDVFLNNMRAGTPEKLGLGYDVVSRYNPRIVYCLGTGFGREGPMAKTAAGDGQIQAFGGWSSIQGQPGGRGELFRQNFHMDLNSSLHLTASILEALYAREKTGLGQFIDCSMVGAAMALQRTRLAEYLATGNPPPLLGSACSTAVPHQAFKCQDQQYLAVGVEDDSQWQRLCAALDAKDLAADQRLADNPGRVRLRDELIPSLESIFRSKPLAWWLLQLQKQHVPCGRIWDFELLKYHPQTVQNHFMLDLNTPWGRVYTGGAPWAFSNTPARMGLGSSPGQDTEALVEETRSASLDAKPAIPQGTLRGGPLSGLTVVELTQGFAGPYCGQLLADGGATVIKVEPPEGDHARKLGPPFQGGESATFLSLNRNKKSVVLRGAGAKANLDKLLKQADVVLADWTDSEGRRKRPSYRQVAALNPKVVFCNLSPFGEKGPLAHQPGSELVIQFMIGLPTGFGRIGDPPVRAGADLVQLSTGVYAYQAIVAALYHRHRTGEGQSISVSLLGCMMNLKGPFWCCQTAPEQWGPPVMGNWTDPPHHGYVTKTTPIFMGMSRFTAADIEAIITELGADLADVKIICDSMDSWEKKLAPEVTSAWERAFSKRTAEEISDIIGRHNGEILPVNDYPSLVKHPQTNVLDMLRVVEHPTAGRVTLIGAPWRLHATPEPMSWAPPPLLGQHTEEVLREPASQRD